MMKLVAALSVCTAISLAFASLTSCVPNNKLVELDNQHITTHKVKTVEVAVLTRDDFKQIECLARNIYFEAAIEQQDGWIAVANVTLNRVKNKKWPNTICEVVYQPKQFSWTIKDKDTEPYDKNLYRDIYSVATLVYNGTLRDITDGSTYYHATYIKTPWWVKKGNLTKVDTIGQHIFYKE